MSGLTLFAAMGLKLDFGEVDYSRNEYSGKVRVVVTKLEENVADLVLTITPMTYEQFNLEGLTLPQDLSADNLPDPAECKHLVACIVPLDYFITINISTDVSMLLVLKIELTTASRVFQVFSNQYLFTEETIFISHSCK